MRIGFDARMIRHSGIGSRIQGLLAELANFRKQREVVLFGPTELLRGYGLDKHYEIIDYNADIYSVQEMLGHPEMRFMDVLDIPHFNAPLRYLKKCIVTVHDIIPIRMKQYHNSMSKSAYLKTVLPLTIKKAGAVVAVSNFTAQDLEKEFQIRASHIEVVHNGVNPEIFRPSAPKAVKGFLKKYKLPASGFLLTVGIGKEHKNLQFLLRNLRSLWESGGLKYPLVIAGSGGRLPDYLGGEFDDLRNQIIIMPRLDILELPLLYAGATLLVFPSLYEGFGFPPLEAQACGCPVLSSGATVMPEILQNSAYYFDPKLDTAFLQSLEFVLSSKTRLQAKVREGRVNATRFRWSDAAHKMVHLYDKMVQSL